MKTTARSLFFIIACTFPIFVGLLHILVHFSELLSTEIQRHLSTEFIILGKRQALWNTWGIVSFMMGAAFVVIGLLNSSIMANLKKTAYPPKSAIGCMVLYQGCVFYVGYSFSQPFQLYGGALGGILLLCCLCITLINDSKSSSETA